MCLLRRDEFAFFNYVFPNVDVYFGFPVKKSGKGFGKTKHKYEKMLWYTVENTTFLNASTTIHALLAN
jgi:hypothetical protein